MASETFSNLSTFYIDLWQHVDAFLDENRWLRIHSVPDIKDRVQALKDRHATLSDGIEGPILEQVNKDFNDVQTLTNNYITQEPKPGDQWFREAEKMRSYLQELGLRYTELASDRVRGRQD